MIGIFDSGSGGLTILDALHRRLPDQDFLYLGDHANAPYGHRSNDQIVEMTRRNVSALFDAGCTLVVLACNTAAAVALRTLQQKWLPQAYPGRRILGVLVPMVEAITGVPWSQEHPVGHDGSGKTILLFATQKTVKSGAYVEEIAKRAPAIRLVQKACPGLVDAIEGGTGPRPLAGLVEGYVAEALDDAGVIPDAVLLGCTHFPLVSSYFEAALPEGVELFCQPDVVAASLEDYLTRHGEFRRKGSGKIRLMTTGKPGDVDLTDSYLPPHLCRFEGGLS
ncbi:glutamate racemase [Kordiimonas aestuarii]|uniref:glutamate racemase n=1 Tax=Kordiimonas aestuarii TaxID=1005925 RepID=UPI0021CF72EA|nr:glutamate racemase [Kordiimonas aestuarii]